MTTSYGVTNAGFRRKPADVIQTEIQNRLLKLYGRKLNLDPRSNNGQYIGISVGTYNDIWALLELLAAIYRPSTASGQGLTDLSAITGTIRKAATPSTLQALLVGTTGTLIPLGSVIRNSSTLVRFSTDANATLIAAPAWVASTPYAIDAVVSKSGHVYVAIFAGTSDVIGPIGTPAFPTTQVDGSVVWAYVGDGTGYKYPVAATCTITGPTSGSSFSINNIGTPVAGWNAVANPTDAVPGDDIESDEKLRIRRIVELHSLSTGPFEAVLSALERTADVTGVALFENPSSVINADGLPANSVEAVVLGGTDADIRATLAANVPSGIQTYGTTSGTITDSRGTVKTIKFTRPTELDIYLVLNVYVVLDKFPADGAAQIKAQVLAFGDENYTMGFDVETWAIAASAALKGVLRVDVYADIIPIVIFTTPVNTPVPVGPRQIAKLDSTRVLVNIIGKTP